MLDKTRPTLTVVIKALNEERHIAGAVESALAAVAAVSHAATAEVVLADSASSDRTVEIARRYPITIVRMDHVEDRSCGAGAQLGYQHSTGEFIYLMDGDMLLHPGFLPLGLDYLLRDPKAAGVGGIITELEGENLEFVKRATKGGRDLSPGAVTRLDCGGLYRRAAIEDVGYLADRNLHGGEELDLGARLEQKGWRLARIDAPAIKHFGHSGSAYRLLLRRLSGRMSMASGELLHAAIGRPHFWRLIANDRTFALWACVHGWWAAMVLAAAVVPGLMGRVLAVAGIALFPVLVMAVRCRSLSLGLYSVAAWNVYAVGLLPGLFRRRVSPRAPIAATVVQEQASCQPIAAEHAR
ncbi:MAG: glycosyltransferase [Variibacter sp.]|nr:glycosyltransferase [Variibacter sp.]